MQRGTAVFNKLENDLDIEKGKQIPDLMLRRIETIDKDTRASRDNRTHATSRLEEQMAR
jgi:hypothetical protein